MLTSQQRIYSDIALAVAICCLAFSFSNRTYAESAETFGTLKIGEKAKDIELKPLDGKKIKLIEMTKEGPVVLVVLRGFPGYQCPVCAKQVGEMRKLAKEFAKEGAKVVLVYPGSADQLEKHAEEFLKGDVLPNPLMLVTDPDYMITNFYGLRWDAPNETAYPATYVLGTDGVVKYRKVSKSHGDRAKAADVLAAVRKLKTA
jgi:peroxiredoxin